MEYINTLSQLLESELDLASQVRLVERLSPLMFESRALSDIGRFLRDLSVPVALSSEAMDIVGTGGDGFNTLNFSTLSAIVVAAAGAPVAKHGAKASTSRCGSFDLLHTLGLPIPASAQEAQACFARHQLVFLFASYFNPLLKKVAPARKVLAEQGKKSLFNCLGPLLNPAQVKRMLVGVYTPKLLTPYAEALQDLGVRHAYIVHSMGLDECSVLGPTQFAKISPEGIEFCSIDPRDLGFELAEAHALTGGAPEDNARESLSLLQCQLSGPKRDTLVLNAALALTVASEFQLSLAAAVSQIDKTLSQGLAYQKLLSMECPYAA